MADAGAGREDRSGRATAAYVVAIDGPAASGKSSTATWVAERLGVRHVDSGELYRAVTLASLASETGEQSWTEERVLAAARHVLIHETEGGLVLRVDGAPVQSEDLHGEAVTQHVSQVARMAGVRAWVNARLHACAAAGPIVVDGRDMGTAVFPDAALKIFLVADPWERARRRLTQRLARLPHDDEIARETEELVRRDARDAPQSQPAPDAILIDTTFLTQEEQVDRIVALAKAASP